MNARFTFWMALITLVGLGSASARGDNYRSKLGFDFKALRTLHQADIGWLAGIRGARFLGKSDAYVGLSASFGTPTGGNPSLENLYNIGAMVGYDGKYSRTGVYELSAFVGFGRGKLAGEETSYYVLEPSFGSGFALGLGWRLLFTASYLHMSHTTQFSGFTMGIRLDRRYDTTIKPLDP